jgi:hypothetical protein
LRTKMTANKQQTNETTQSNHTNCLRKCKLNKSFEWWIDCTIKSLTIG